MSLGVIWFCVGIICTIGEIISLTFVLLFFGIGAFAASAMCLFTDNTTLTFFVFSLASILSLLCFRGRLVNMFGGRIKLASENKKEARTIEEKPSQVGRTGLVSRELGSGIVGEVSLGGSFWRAIANESIPIGTSIRVIEHDAENEILLHVARNDR